MKKTTTFAHLALINLTFSCVKNRHDTERGAVLGGAGPVFRC